MSVIVQVSELSFLSEDGLKVLDEIHLRVNRGELVFITGPAAAGKSVLMGLLATQVAPQRGQILVHGRNIARMSRKKAYELRQRIGYLPRGFTPLSRTPMENLMFKLRALGYIREAAEEKALIALEQVGLSSRLSSHPESLEPADWVRVGLALLLCTDPVLLLLDEPFAKLDSEGTAEVCGLLNKLRERDLTTVLATREIPPMLEHTFRVVRLADGRIVSS